MMSDPEAKPRVDRSLSVDPFNPHARYTAAVKPRRKYAERFERGLLSSIKLGAYAGSSGLTSERADQTLGFIHAADRDRFQNRSAVSRF